MEVKQIWNRKSEALCLICTYLYLNKPYFNKPCVPEFGS